MVTGSVFHIEARKFLLHSLFDKASRVVPSKEIMPVLRNFQVDAANGRLRVAATDLELSVISTTEMVYIAQPGRIVLPARKMLDIVVTAVGDDMIIDVVNGIATVLCGRARWTLKLASGEDYPPLPEIAEINLYDIDRGRFLGALNAVRYAASTDVTRANLAMIDVTNGRMTATDGARFQQAELGEEFPLSLQIPISAVDDLLRMLRDTDLAVISVGESENHIVFRVGADVFVANKLMAQFPNVQAQLLGPALRNTDELFVDREDILAVIKRVRINADTETSAIVLQLHTDEVMVRSRDKYGNACEEVLSAGWKFADRTLVMNHKFLTDMITMYDGRTCRLVLGEDATKTKRSPIMLRDEQTGTTGVIQQMRADWVMSGEGK